VPERVERKSHTGLIVAIAVAAVVLFAAVAGLVAWKVSGGSGAQGYNNPTTLENGIQQTANDKGGAGTVTSVSCVSSATHQFICHVEQSNTSPYTVTATVSSDGQTFVTNSGS
jgi:flagellar basal body-associated protein FliL